MSAPVRQAQGLRLADWLARQPVPEACAPPARRALAAIRRCRTPALGGHVYRCADCAGADYAYHSCHHRACPRCGGGRTAAWTARQLDRLLPVPYFLVTCTVPAELRPAFAARPEPLCDTLFATAARALQTVAAQPRHLGAELGLIGVLHTWGRQLQWHPHVHFIVPGGGLTADRKRWRACRHADYLLPVAAVAAQFRLGFEVALRATAPGLHAAVPASVWEKPWIVHCQPAGDGATAVKYLARYVQRTAIADERIVALGDDAVTFHYRDSATQEKKECTLDAGEFLRRYLQHAPPAGAHRVRYFGWLHPAAQRRRLLVETLLAVVIVVRPPVDAPPPWHLRCPHCGHFALVRVGTLPRSPPACDR